MLILAVVCHFWGAVRRSPPRNYLGYGSFFAVLVLNLAAGVYAYILQPLLPKGWSALFLVFPLVELCLVGTLPLVMNYCSFFVSQKVTKTVAIVSVALSVTYYLRFRMLELGCSEVTGVDGIIDSNVMSVGRLFVSLKLVQMGIMKFRHPSKNILHTGPFDFDANGERGDDNDDNDDSDDKNN